MDGRDQSGQSEATNDGGRQLHHPLALTFHNWPITSLRSQTAVAAEAEENNLASDRMKANDETEIAIKITM